MLEVGSAIRKVARVLWSMHTLFQEVRTLTRRDYPVCCCSQLIQP